VADCELTAVFHLLNLLSVKLKLNLFLRNKPPPPATVIVSWREVWKLLCFFFSLASLELIFLGSSLALI